METLKEVRECLNSIPCINEGGCAISALAMYEWLESKGKLTNSTTIAYLYSNDCIEFQNNSNGISDNCHHAALLHNGMYLDSNKRLDTYIKFKLNLSVNEAKKSINEIEWNNTFNRSWVRKIRKELNIRLNYRDYE